MPDGRSSYGFRRRDALSLLGVSTLVAALPGQVCAATCPPEDELSPAEVALRKALNFTPVAPSPDKACGVCQFYQAPGEACGRCTLLSSEVPAAGVCGSWAQRKS